MYTRSVTDRGVDERSRAAGCTQDIINSEAHWNGDVACPGDELLQPGWGGTPLLQTLPRLAQCQHASTSGIGVASFISWWEALS